MSSHPSIIAQPLDLESIPGQIGTAIICPPNFVAKNNNNDARLHQHSITCTGEMTEKDADIMYSILLEIGAVLSPQSTMVPKPAVNHTQTGREDTNYDDMEGYEALKKFTVSFPSVQYSCCVSSTGYSFVVKRRSP